MDEMNTASPLKQAAIAAHEMYSELKGAGFSRREALELVSKIFTSVASTALDEDRGN